MRLVELRALAGLPVGKVVRRLLKPLVLAALDWCREEVQEHWQQGQGPAPLQGFQRRPDPRDGGR